MLKNCWKEFLSLDKQGKGVVTKLNFEAKTFYFTCKAMVERNNTPKDGSRSHTKMCVVKILTKNLKNNSFSAITVW